MKFVLMLSILAHQDMTPHFTWCQTTQFLTPIRTKYDTRFKSYCEEWFSIEVNFCFLCEIFFNTKQKVHFTFMPLFSGNDLPSPKHMPLVGLMLSDPVKSLKQSAILFGASNSEMTNFTFIFTTVPLTNLSNRIRIFAK